MPSRPFIFMSLLVALCGTSLVPATVTADSPKVKALLTERRDALAKRVELLRLQHEHSGQVLWITVLEARDELLVAEIELADSPEKRIEVLKARVKNQKAAEDFYLVGQRNGDASELDVLQAKAKRLAAEVDLERAIEGDSNGKPDLDLSNVSGKIMLRGKPLPNATVKFQPENGPTSYGKTNEAGEYMLKLNGRVSGAVVGNHTVSINTARRIEDPKTGEVRSQPETLPPRYNSASGLKASVHFGGNVIDFDLSDEK